VEHTRDLKNNILKKIFLILCFITSSLKAQVVLQGYVQDSLQHPLSYATVLAKPIDSTASVKYTITNDAGFYNLLLKEHAVYQVTVRIMGFKPKSIHFNAERDATIKFEMHQSTTMLDEVVVKLPSIVTVRNDTTTYKTDNFVTGRERKLKDVLKKLPGVTVSKNGSVEFKGKKVTKLLVEGKDFFNGGTRLGVENIPSDAIAKIQMLENYNEVSFLKGLSDDDAVAMNVLLKEDKKRFVFGDVSAGLGNAGYYKAKANTFYYSPKTGINLIANTNNRAEQTLTFRDYLNFNGGINAVFNVGIKKATAGLDQFLSNGENKIDRQQFVALNVTRTKSKKWDIASYFMYANKNKKSFKTALNDYTFYVENSTTQTALKNRFAIWNFRLNYAANTRNKLKPLQL